MQMDNGGKGHTNKHAIAASQGGEASGRRTEGTPATGQRRRWSEDERARIVEESLKPGARVSEVAKRHGVSRGMVFEWRRQAKAGEPRQDAGRSRPAFVPVTIAPEKTGAQQIGNDAPAIEIELGDIRIRVKGRVDGPALRTVLSALQAARC
jgi:transposase